MTARKRKGMTVEGRKDIRKGNKRKDNDKIFLIKSEKEGKTLKCNA